MENAIAEARKEGKESDKNFKSVHIFVEIDRHNKVKLEFDDDQVTGQEIKTKAGVPLENDLARRQGQQLELVTNEQTITIKNGEHFVSLPPGTIS